MSVFFFRRVSKAYEHYQNQDAVVSTTLQENLTGVRVVKAFARQDYEMNKFEKDNYEKFVRGKRLLILHSLFWPSADILCAGQMVAGLYHRRVDGHERCLYARLLCDLHGSARALDLAHARIGSANRAGVHRDGVVWTSRRDHPHGT